MAAESYEQVARPVHRQRTPYPSRAGRRPAITGVAGERGSVARDRGDDSVGGYLTDISNLGYKQIAYAIQRHPTGSVQLRTRSLSAVAGVAQ